MYLIQEPYVWGDHVLFRTCEYLENRRVLGYQSLVLSELSINFVLCNSSDALKGADFLHSSQNALQIEWLRAHKVHEHCLVLHGWKGSTRRQLPIETHRVAGLEQQWAHSHANSSSQTPPVFLSFIDSSQQTHGKWSINLLPSQGRSNNFYSDTTFLHRTLAQSLQRREGKREKIVMDCGKGTLELTFPFQTLKHKPNVKILP